MNDTHGVGGEGWYAFGLDGTLAMYDKWEGIDSIGGPVKLMVDLMKRMRKEGKDVRILTARVAPRPEQETKPNPFLGAPMEKLPPVYPFANVNEYKALYGMAEWGARQFITDWCARNLGFIPEITYEKDHRMITLFDDRVRQVIPNAGLLIDDLYEKACSMLNKIHAEKGRLLAKIESKRNGFWAGFWLAFLLYLLVGSGIKAYETWFGPGKDPARVRFEAAHKVLCDLVNDWPVKEGEEKR